MKLLLLSGRPEAGKTRSPNGSKSNVVSNGLRRTKRPFGRSGGRCLCNSHRPGVASATRAKAEALGEQVVIEWGFVADLIFAASAIFGTQNLIHGGSIVVGSGPRAIRRRREKLSPWELKNAVNNYHIRQTRLRRYRRTEELLRREPHRPHRHFRRRLSAL